MLKGYPRLSETFIAQELLALEERGHRFDIWSLRAPYDGGRTHPIHDRIRARPHYLPEYLHDDPARVLRAWRAVRGLPGYPAARAAWLRDLRRDGTRNRVRRWGQALVLAAELPEEVGLLYAHFLHTPASVARYAALIRGIRWAFSAHAKDIWTIPDWEKREKIAAAAFGVTCTRTGADASARACARGRQGRAGLSRARPRPLSAAARHRPAREAVHPAVGRAAGGEEGLRRPARRAGACSRGRLDWRLWHIGGGERARALGLRAARLGLAGRIEWRGKRAQGEVVDAMRRADLFVLPSKIAPDGDRDGLPNVLMEAASQKLPILSTAVSAHPGIRHRRRCTAGWCRPAIRRRWPRPSSQLAGAPDDAPSAGRRRLCPAGGRVRHGGRASTGWRRG